MRFTVFLLLSLALALSPCLSASAVERLDADISLDEGESSEPVPEDAALDEAQELLSWAYDLTPATLSLFRCQAEKSNDGVWRITYTGDMPYPEPLGDYTVVLYPDAPPDVRWSHDDVDPSVWQTGWLSAPVWGQEQLAQAYDAIVHRKPAVIEPLDWISLNQPIEELTSTTAQVDGIYTHFTFIPPGPADISLADAAVFARRAIYETYGIDAEALAGYTESCCFVTPVEGDAPQYLFRFKRNAFQFELITCGIASPSGEVLHCAWIGDARLRPLPAGPLDTHIQAQAAMDFLKDGSLAYHNAVEKADIVQRMYQAGYGEALPHTEVYDFPGPEDLSEEEAVAVARAALEREYAFPAEAFTLFETYTSLLAYPDNRQWVVDFPHKEFWETTGLRGVAYGLGTYQVTLTADTGEVLSASWDKAKQDTGIVYTRETWGSAYNSSHDALLPARILPWVTELYRQLSVISARYPEGSSTLTYSTEDAAATDTLLRASGFPRTTFGNALPDGSGIPLGVAVFRARKVLRDKDVSRSVLDASELQIAYSVGAVTGPSWVCSFHLEDGEWYAEYIIGVDAATGEILFTKWTY